MRRSSGSVRSGRGSVAAAIAVEARAELRYAEITHGDAKTLASRSAIALKTRVPSVRFTREPSEGAVAVSEPGVHWITLHRGGETLGHLYGALVAALTTGENGSPRRVPLGSHGSTASSWNGLPFRSHGLQAAQTGGPPPLWLRQVGRLARLIVEERHPVRSC